MNRDVLAIRLAVGAGVLALLAVGLRFVPVEQDPRVNWMNVGRPYTSSDGTRAFPVHLLSVRPNVDIELGFGEDGNVKWRRVVRRAYNTKRTVGQSEPRVRPAEGREAVARPGIYGAGGDAGSK